MPKNNLDRLRYQLLLKNQETIKDLNVCSKDISPTLEELQERQYNYCYLYDNPGNPKGWRNDGYRSSWDCKSHWSFPMKGKLKRKIDKIALDSNRELHRWATQLNYVQIPQCISNLGLQESHTFVEYFLKSKGKQLELSSVNGNNPIVANSTNLSPILAKDTKKSNDGKYNDIDEDYEDDEEDNESNDGGKNLTSKSIVRSDPMSAIINDKEKNASASHNKSFENSNDDNSKSNSSNNSNSTAIDTGNSTSGNANSNSNSPGNSGNNQNHLNNSQPNNPITSLVTHTVNHINSMTISNSHSHSHSHSHNSNNGNNNINTFSTTNHNSNSSGTITSAGNNAQSHSHNHSHSQNHSHSHTHSHNHNHSHSHILSHSHSNHNSHNNNVAHNHGHITHVDIEIDTVRNRERDNDRDHHRERERENNSPSTNNTNNKNNNDNGFTSNNINSNISINSSKISSNIKIGNINTTSNNNSNNNTKMNGKLFNNSMTDNNNSFMNNININSTSNGDSNGNSDGSKKNNSSGSSGDSTSNNRGSLFFFNSSGNSNKVAKQNDPSSDWGHLFALVDPSNQSFRPVPTTPMYAGPIGCTVKGPESHRNPAVRRLELPALYPNLTRKPTNELENKDSRHPFRLDKPGEVSNPQPSMKPILRKEEIKPNVLFPKLGGASDQVGSAKDKMETHQTRNRPLLPRKEPSPNCEEFQKTLSQSQQQLLHLIHCIPLLENLPDNVKQKIWSACQSTVFFSNYDQSSFSKTIQSWNNDLQANIMPISILFTTLIVLMKQSLIGPEFNYSNSDFSPSSEARTFCIKDIAEKPLLQSQTPTSKPDFDSQSTPLKRPRIMDVSSLVGSTSSLC